MMPATAVLPLAMLASAAWGATTIGRYDFAAPDPTGVVVDQSGFDNHGQLVGQAQVADGAVACGGAGYVELPAGEVLFGPRAESGGVSLWVRPDFDPGELPSGQWEGYSMLFYAMQTDGNGLPDGSQEIGLWCHGPQLFAKCAATGFGASIAVPSPLRQGQWSHVVFTWGPQLRALYVDGTLLDKDESPNVPVSLDAFPVMIGQHPSSKQWAWRGDIADCELFDDVVDEPQVRRLSAGRRPPEPGLADPHQPWVEAVDWGRLWLGKREVALSLRLRPPVTKAEIVVEQLHGGTRDVGPPLAVTAGQAPVAVKVLVVLTTEGLLRVNALVREPGTGRVLGARSAFLDVPPLRPTLAETERKLLEIDQTLRSARLPGTEIVSNATAKDRQDVAGRFAALRDRASGPSTAEEWQQLIEESKQLRADADRLLTRTTIYARGVKDGKLPAFGIGVDHPLTKYLKDDPFGGKLEAPVELKAARNEYEAAQLLIFALDADLQGVDVRAGSLTGPGGATIPAANLAWNHVGYVQTTKPTYEVRHVGLWPDPLLPPAPFDVAKGAFEIVWLTVHVPADAAPGDYEGTVTLAPQNAPPRDVMLRLHVWGFVLPQEASLTTAFGLNSMGSFAGNMDVGKYVQNAFEHRISLGFPGSVFAAATPVYPSFDLAGRTFKVRVRAEGDAPELGPLFLLCSSDAQNRPHVYGPVPLTKGEWTEASLALRDDERPTFLRLEYRNGGPVALTFAPLEVDGKPFDAMDNPDWWPAGGPWASVEKSAEGLRFSISAPKPDEPLIEQWPHLERSAVETPSDIPFHMDFAEFDARIEKYLGQGINAIFVPVPGCPRETGEAEAQELVRRTHLGPIAKAYQDHLEEKGWLKYAYTYVSDEPEAGDYPALNVVQGTIRRWAPKLPNMITARSFPPQLEYVDIWCPELYSFNPQAAAAEQAKGKRVWWYPAFSTRHPFPDFWVDYPALDNRVIFWLTWKHKLDGLLYWSITNYWKADPWENAMTFPGANGDGTLVYPGPDGGPVNSLRWECLRDGAEDYEYFVLLRDLAAKARAKPEARDLVQRADRLLTIDDTVARSWREWNADPAPLLAARDEMGEVIEALQEVTR